MKADTASLYFNLDFHKRGFLTAAQTESTHCRKPKHRTLWEGRGGDPCCAALKIVVPLELWKFFRLVSAGLPGGDREIGKNKKPSSAAA